ncbi:MAG: helix-turn-helix transcriptional regulator [Saprospiraceae bacterium]
MTDFNNIASILLLLGAGQGIFFSLILFGWAHNNRKAYQWLGSFLILFSLSMIGTVLYDQRVVLIYPHLGLVSAPLGTAMGFTLYLYVKELTDKNYRFVGWQWLHLLPALISVIILTPFYLLPVDQKKTAMEASYAGFPMLWKINFIFSTTVNSIYIIATILTVMRHERHIRQLYSNTVNRSLIWVRHFLMAGISTFFICILMSMFDIARADTISNLMFSFVIYVMGYRALRQPEIFNDLPAQVVESTDEPAIIRIPVKYGKSGLNEDKAPALIRELDRLMSEEKLFLDPELTLLQLSQRLGIPAHQASQLLNQHKGQTFFDFINSLRVEYFKLAITNPANEHLSLLAIALDSGFNSKAAFNSVFKRVTGMTPSQYKYSMTGR